MPAAVGTADRLVLVNSVAGGTGPAPWEVSDADTTHLMTEEARTLVVESCFPAALVSHEK